jgi:hypothetical protein
MKRNKENRKEAAGDNSGPDLISTQPVNSPNPEPLRANASTSLTVVGMT